MKSDNPENKFSLSGSDDGPSDWLHCPTQSNGKETFFFFMSNDPTALLSQGLPGSLNIPLIRKCEFYTHLPLTHVTLGKFLNLTPSYYLIKEMRRLHISHSKTFQKAKIPFIISPVPFPSKLHLITNYLCFFFLRNHIFA